MPTRNKACLRLSYLWKRSWSKAISLRPCRVQSKYVARKEWKCPAKCLSAKSCIGNCLKGTHTTQVKLGIYHWCIYHTSGTAKWFQRGVCVQDGEELFERQPAVRLPCCWASPACRAGWKRKFRNWAQHCIFWKDPGGNSVTMTTIALERTAAEIPYLASINVGGEAIHSFANICQATSYSRKQVLKRL